MSYSCVHCGQYVNSSHNSSNCPAVLAQKQNKLLQESIDLQKKQNKAQQRASDAALNAEAKNRKSMFGGSMGAFLNGYYSRVDVAGPLPVKIVGYCINIFLIYPIALFLGLCDMYRAFAERFPEAHRKIKKVFYIFIFSILILGLMIMGIQNFYEWADSYNYGLVGFWIVIALVGGFIALMVFPLIFSKKARDRFKNSYDEGYNNRADHLSNDAHKENH